MKQKNYKWLIYVLGILILGSLIYIAFKDISPMSRTIEKKVEINYNK